MKRRKPGGTGSPSQLLTKKQRRLFMSGKAADVHTDAAEQVHVLRSKGKPDGVLTSKEFKELRREVDSFGEQPVLCNLPTWAWCGEYL